MGAALAVRRGGRCSPQGGSVGAVPLSSRGCSLRFVENIDHGRSCDRYTVDLEANVTAEVESVSLQLGSGFALQLGAGLLLRSQASSHCTYVVVSPPP